jgi:hypothetical protein
MKVSYKMIMIDGRIVDIGDVVCFKSDIEQCGEIIRISGSTLTLKARSHYGFEGDYIGGEEFTTVNARDCW